MADNVKLVLEFDSTGAIAGMKNFGSSMQKETKEASGALDGLSGKLAAVGAGIAAYFTVGAIKGFFTTIIDESMDAQKQLNQLAGAMERGGTYTEAAMQKMDKFSTALMRNSTLSGDVIVGQLAIARQFTKTDEQARKMVQTAADLSAAMGISLDTAVTRLGQTFSGSAGRLVKTVTALKGVSEEALKSGAAIEIVGNAMRDAALNQTKTFEGALLQTKNAFDDFMESMGDFIVQNPMVVEAIRQVTTMFFGLQDGLKSGKSATDGIIDRFMLGLVDALRGVIPYINGTISFFKSLAAVVLIVSDGVKDLIEILMLLGLSFAGLWEKMVGGSKALTLFQVTMDDMKARGLRTANFITHMFDETFNPKDISGFLASLDAIAAAAGKKVIRVKVQGGIDTGDFLDPKQIADAAEAARKAFMAKWGDFETGPVSSIGSSPTGGLQPDPQQYAPDFPNIAGFIKGFTDFVVPTKPEDYVQIDSQKVPDISSSYAAILKSIWDQTKETYDFMFKAGEDWQKKLISVAKSLNPVFMQALGAVTNTIQAFADTSAKIGKQIYSDVSTSWDNIKKSYNDSMKESEYKITKRNSNTPSIPSSNPKGYFGDAFNGDKKPDNSWDKIKAQLNPELSGTKKPFNSFKTNRPQEVDFFGSMFQKLGDSMAPVKAVVSALGTAMTSIDWKGVGSKCLGFLTDMGKRALTFAGDIGIGAVTGGVAVATTAVTSTVGNISKGKDGVMPAIVETMGAMGSAFDKALGTGSMIGDILKSFLNALSDPANLKAMIRGFIDAIPSIIDSLIEAIPVLMDGIVQALPVLLAGIIKMIPVLFKAIAEGIGPILITLSEAIPDIIITVCENIGPIITAIAEALPKVLSNLIGAIPAIFSALVRAIIDICWTLISKALPNIIKGLFDGIVNAIKSMFNGLKIGGGSSGFSMSGVFGGGSKKSKSEDSSGSGQLSLVASEGGGQTNDSGVDAKALGIGILTGKIVVDAINGNGTARDIMTGKIIADAVKKDAGVSKQDILTGKAIVKIGDAVLNKTSNKKTTTQDLFTGVAILKELKRNKMSTTDVLSGNVVVKAIKKSTEAKDILTGNVISKIGGDILNSKSSQGPIKGQDILTGNVLVKTAKKSGIGDLSTHKASDTGSKAVKDLSAGMQSVIDWFKNLGTKIWNQGVLPLVTWFANLFTQIWTQGIYPLVTWFANLFSPIWDQGIYPLITWFANLFTQIWQQGIYPLVLWFVNLGTTIWDQGILPLVNWFIGIGTKIWNEGILPLVTWFANLGLNIWNNGVLPLINFFAALPAKLWDKIQEAFGGKKKSSDVYGEWTAGSIGGTKVSMESVFGKAEGGIVPKGYQNDSYPAALTSGELVIPAGTTPALINLIDSVSKGGVNNKSNDETNTLLKQLIALIAGQQTTVNVQLDKNVLARAILSLSQDNRRLA